MFWTSPEADIVTGSPATAGLVAVIVKLRLFPAWTVWGPGAFMVGGVLGSTTVIVIEPGTDVRPSVMLKVIV